MNAYKILSDGSFEVKKLRRPKCGPKNLVVKVMYSGICGSDLQRRQLLVQGGCLKEAVLGHECVGRVVWPRRSLLYGSVVTCIPFGGCGNCDNCQRGLAQHCVQGWALGKTMPGSCAEYVSLPQSHVIPLPPRMPWKIGCLCDPVACAMHAVRQSSLSKGDTVAILGGGTLGLSIALLAMQHGCPVTIFSTKAARLTRFGVRCIPPAETIRFASKFDIGFEVIGRAQSSSLEQAFSLTRPCGRVVVVGVYPSDYNITFRRAPFEKELTIVGSNSYSIPKDFLDALKVIESQISQFRALITHCFPIDKIEHAYEVARNAEMNSAIKVLLTWAN